MASIGQALAAVVPRQVLQPVDRQPHGERHARIGELLARDAAAWQITPGAEQRPQHQGLQLRAHREGADLRWIELTVCLRITPDELARAMLVRLDEALGLDGVLQQHSPWASADENALAELAISVAERIQGSCGDAGELDNEVSSAVTAANHGVHGVACYLIERLGIGEAFDALAEFAREHFIEQLHRIERMHS